MLRLLLAALLLASACGPAVGRGDSTRALAGLPPLQDPPVVLDDAEDLERARTALRGLLVDDAARAPRRRELLAAYGRQVERALAEDRPEDAIEAFDRALLMWEPAEIAARKDLADVAPLAERLFELSSRRGASAETFTTLAVLLAARPERKAEYEERYREIAAYLDDLATSDNNPGAKRARTIAALEKTIVSFPSPWVRDTLVALYLERQATIHGSIQNGPVADRSLRALTEHGRSAVEPVQSVIAAFAMTGDLAGAKPVVARLAGQAFDDETARERLDAVLAKGAGGQAFRALASLYLSRTERNEDEALRNVTAGLRVCEEGVRRLPRAWDALACQGLAAAQLREVPLALRLVEQAHALDRKNRDVADLLSRLLLQHLRDHVSAERIHAGRRILARLEELHDAFKAQPLEVPPTEGLLIMAQGLFNAGEIEEATALWRKVLAWPKARPASRAEALEQLATVAIKRARYREAARLFEESASIPRDTPLEEKLAKAKLLRLAGDARSGAGEEKLARERWAASLAEWDELGGAGGAMSNFGKAQVALGRARVLYALGRQREAVAAFEEAVDVNAEESSTYADAISFLLTHGHFEPALAAYQRSLRRSEITEYFKVYTSLWIIDFGRLKGLPADPQAVEYLGSREGSRWYHELARYRSGKLDYKGLLERADTRGKRAEAYFYEAMHRYAEKDEDAARDLLRLVLATDMLGFFEHEMAMVFLKSGPPR